MRRLIGTALVATMLAFGFAARAEESVVDPAKVSDSLKAIFQFGSAQTKQALNQNTVTLITGTIGGTYVQFGADLASVLDEGDQIRVLPIVGRGSVQSIADILFLKGVDLALALRATLGEGRCRTQHHDRAAGRHAGSKSHHHGKTPY